VDLATPVDLPLAAKPIAADSPIQTETKLPTVSPRRREADLARLADLPLAAKPIAADSLIQTETELPIVSPMRREADLATPADLPLAAKTVTADLPHETETESPKVSQLRREADLVTPADLPLAAKPVESDSSHQTETELPTVSPMRPEPELSRPADLPLREAVQPPIDEATMAALEADLLQRVTKRLQSPMTMMQPLGKKRAGLVLEAAQTRLLSGGWRFKSEATRRVADPRLIQEKAQEIERGSGGGQRLASQPRAILEQSLQRDLGEVRIHTADLSPLNIQAAARGRDIYLQRGMETLTSEGANVTPQALTLLGHELTHTVQRHGQSSAQSVPLLLRQVRADEAQAERQEKKIAQRLSPKRIARLSQTPTARGVMKERKPTFTPLDASVAGQVGQRVRAKYNVPLKSSEAQAMDAPLRFPSEGVGGVLQPQTAEGSPFSQRGGEMTPADIDAMLQPKFIDSSAPMRGAMGVIQRSPDDNGVDKSTSNMEEERQSTWPIDKLPELVEREPQKFSVSEKEVSSFEDKPKETGGLLGRKKSQDDKQQEREKIKVIEPSRPTETVGQIEARELKEHWKSEALTLRESSSMPTLQPQISVDASQMKDEDDDEAKGIKPDDLDELARLIYPLLRRMLAVEQERRRGDFRVAW